MDARASRGAALRGVPAVWLVYSLLLEAVLIQLSEFRELIGQWARIAGLTHGYLVAALIPAFIWWRRARIAAAGDRRGAGIAAVIVGAAALAFARAASVDAAVASLLPVNVLLAAWVGLGLRGAMAIAFPLGYFWLALPVTDQLTPVLQWLTVKVSTLLLGMLGVSTLIDGSYVTVPGGSFEIAAGCAGTHYAVVALATAGLFAMLEALPWRRTCLLFGIA